MKSSFLPSVVAGLAVTVVVTVDGFFVTHQQQQQQQPPRPMIGHGRCANVAAAAAARGPSGLLLFANQSSTGTNSSRTNGGGNNELDRDLLQTALNAEGLGLCHGILHAVGVRRLNDVQTLTDAQMTDMGLDACDRRNLVRVIARLKNTSKVSKSKEPTRDKNNNNNHKAVLELSTVVHGAFDEPTTWMIPQMTTEPPPPPPFAGPNFEMQVVSAEHSIFRGRLFTAEQCRQLNRMAEYYSYQGIGTLGMGWTNELYTLTTQHMHCKDIPHMMESIDDLVFQQLQQELYTLFSPLPSSLGEQQKRRIRPGSIVLQSDGEPHLVKYHGKHKGTVMHTDNSNNNDITENGNNDNMVYITVNVLLSAKEDDFCGGGTYIQALDETIHLEQGEMLIHLGDLEHAGMAITSGVRRLLVSFFACHWETYEEEEPNVNIAVQHIDKDIVAHVSGRSM